MLRQDRAVMTTQTISRRRRLRGVHPKRTDGEPETPKLPEYMEADAVAAIIGRRMSPGWAADAGAVARQSAGVGSACPRGLGPVSGGRQPDAQSAVGQGQACPRGPVHPELAAAFRLVLSYGTVSDGRLVDVHRSTVWRWVQTAVKRAKDLGAIPVGRRVGTHSAAATLDTC